MPGEASSGELTQISRYVSIVLFVASLATGILPFH